MVFQPFLDRSPRRPARGRGYVVSLALHGVVALLVWLAWGQVEAEDPPVPAKLPVAVSLRPPGPQRAPELVGPAAPVPATERARKPGSWLSAPRRAPAVALAPTSEAPPGDQRVAEDERDDEPGPVDHGGDLGGTPAGGPGASGGPSREAGEGGGRAAPRRPIELFGRVVGGNRREMTGPQGLPYASLKESTELRTYDVFPPLPASQWAGDRPYAIVVDVCVSGEGQVSDVALVKPASRIFDPVVLEAVRTWRYKPRLVDGQARAFCHVVAIKYEQL
jgi:TonB family protein